MDIGPFLSSLFLSAYDSLFGTLVFVIGISIAVAVVLVIVLVVVSRNEKKK